MAARKRNWLTDKSKEKIRASIKTGLLVKRLENHALGDKAEEGFKDMTQTQLKAAEILLQRTMPTLSSSEIVETTPEPKMDEAYAQLKALVGEDMANKLMAGKAKIEHTQPDEPTIIHEQPEQTQ